MSPHPDQITPQEAADALGTLAGVAERASQVEDLVRGFKHLVVGMLPGAVQESAAEPDSESANARLAALQVEAADRAVEILAAMDLLYGRLGKARPALALALARASRGDTETAVDALMHLAIPSVGKAA
ncbi:hypothetical protein [Xanthobacter sp.]|uniref:hypothetical protein n=1 Tax=Xanthobacter sp. TaxID=35809 RepID=UPI0025E99C5D|nr:hypothetical protein [Xanthobacter sp.]